VATKSAGTFRSFLPGIPPLRQLKPDCKENRDNRLKYIPGNGRDAVHASLLYSAFLTIRVQTKPKKSFVPTFCDIIQVGLCEYLRVSFCREKLSRCHWTLFQTMKPKRGFIPELQLPLAVCFGFIFRNIFSV
jgi:hypothetical protein